MTGLWDVVKHTIDTNGAIMDVIFSLLYNLQAKVSHRMAAILWSIWRHRNLKLWKKNENELCRHG